MIYAILGIVLLVIFLLIAVRIGVNREKTEPTLQNPVIHKSGIYSIVRRSPREHIAGHKPAPEVLAKYLSEQNVDIEGKPLSSADKERIKAQWQSSLDANIAEIELGDKEGVEFYIYEYDRADPVCGKIVPRGCFVSREQIFKYPKIIPPFHLGCTCRLKRYRGDENLRSLRDTSVTRMRCLFDESNLPTLPEWNKILA